MLTEKDLAPTFTSRDQDENYISLKDFKGQKVVLFFYPKDNTPGCTIESCAFRETYQDFLAKNVQIIGCSRDSAKKHQNFISKYNLPYPLIADIDSKLCNAFGVIKEKSMFGKKYMGIERSTFLIDENGVIEKVWPKVKIPGHVQDVLASIT